MRCRICESKNIKTFFNLGRQPLANTLPKSLFELEDFYPLSLSWCPDCNLVQLNQTISPEKLFSEYVWVTGTSKTTREYAETFYERIVSRLPKASPRQRYVLEVASNDGTFLLPFIHNGYKVLGVDPAKNIAALANSNGVPTKCCFFGKVAAKQLLKEHGPAHIVFARNVLPHVANTRDFVEGLQMCLDDEGILAIEVHYAKEILQGLHYDSIYHEHLCYFTLKSIERLLNDFHLFVYDILKSPISGGSIVVYAKKKKIKEMPSVERYRRKEKEERINDFDSWKDFAKRAILHRRKLLEILDKALKKNGLIAGYGASARSSTLLNFCKIDSNIFSIIADQNPMKQGRFTAGSHIPITSPEVVMRMAPKHILILAWNFADEIIKILRNKFNYKGKIIIPLPNKPYLYEGRAGK